MNEFKCAICFEDKKEMLNYCGVCKEQKICENCVYELVYQKRGLQWFDVFLDGYEAIQCPCCRVPMYKVLHSYNIINIFESSHGDFMALDLFIIHRNKPIRKYLFNLFRDDYYATLEEYDNDN